jgi:hypothetical protein
MYIGLREPDSLAIVEVYARTDPASPWVPIAAPVAAESLTRVAPGLAVPLAWPADWRVRGDIAESLKVVLKFRGGTDHARIDRIALYPRAGPAPGAGVRH